MRQLLGLGVIAVGAIAVFAAVTGNYKQALAALGLSINGGTADIMTPAPKTDTTTTRTTTTRTIATS